MKALLAVVLTLAAGAAPQPRFELVGHLAPPGAYTADVVAHRGHAYLSSERQARSCPALGVRAVDIRVPSTPKLVASFARVPGTWTEKTIVRRVATAAFRGDLAVTSFQRCDRESDAFQGFGIYDVTNPRRPRELALVRTEPRGSHEIWLATARGHAWVYTAIPNAEQLAALPGFRIFDVTEPTEPRQVGGWSLSDIGVTARPYRMGTGDVVHSVMTDPAATRAYLSYWDYGIVILDIADPTKPQYLGRAYDGPHAHSASLNGSLLAVTHEIDNGRPTLFDVSDPRRPQRLARVTLPAGLRPGGATSGTSGLDLTVSVHDAKLVGTAGYFSWYGQGIVAFDLSNPRRPRYLTRYVPQPTRDPDGLLCPGRRCTSVWGVYPLEKGLVLGSDMNSGLWIVRLR